MSKTTRTTIEVQGVPIAILTERNEDFISLTDMLKAKDGDFFVSDWLRNRNTVEFLSIWESVHNPGFNYGECATIKSQVGLNSYKLSVKDWVTQTNAIGLRASAGRYGGTYSHKDIAFEFGMWISPAFKIYLIKESSASRTKKGNGFHSPGTSTASFPRSTTASIPMRSGSTWSRRKSRPPKLRPPMPTKPIC